MRTSQRRLLAEIATAIGICVAVVFFLAPNIHVLFLGRDESLCAYFGERASGIRLYRDFWDTHFPALYYLYALAFRAGGTDGMVWIRMAHIVFQLLGGFAFYALARGILRPGFARLAAVAYAAYSVSTIIEGHIANVEPFVLPLILASLALTREPHGQPARDRRNQRWRDLGAGFLLGIASLFKQYFVLYMLVPVAATALGLTGARGRVTEAEPGGRVTGAEPGDPVAGTETGRPVTFADGWRAAFRRIPFFLAGAVVPIVAMVVLLARQGLVRDMIQATVSFLVTDRLVQVGLFTRLHDTYKLWRILPGGHPFLVAGALAGLALLRRSAQPAGGEHTPRAGGHQRRDSSAGSHLRPDSSADAREPRPDPPAEAERAGRAAPGAPLASARWLALWLAVSVFMVLAGERAYPHYLELVAPPMCALAFLALQTLWDARARTEGFAATFALVGLLVLDIGLAAMKTVPLYGPGGGRVPDATATASGPADLALAAPIGEYVKEHTSQDDRILVWGPIPAIYHYAARSAPTRYVNLIPVARPYLGRDGDTSIPGTMEELRQEIGRNPPAYIVVVPTMACFDVAQPHFLWLRELLQADYTLERSFGEDARVYKRLSPALNPSIAPLNQALAPLNQALAPLNLVPLNPSLTPRNPALATP